MGIDRERVLIKVGYIREQVTSIKQLLAKKSKQEIINDAWVLRGLKYAIQTTIEALIDIAYHISAKEYNHAPTDARDAIKALVENGLVSRKYLDIYGGMVGFRNRVVHGYQEVTPDRVYEIANKELDDFNTFIKQISVLL
ncbi:type VII toxin-antitoxin system HepT family RNase toxin [Desulfotruncus alcoholivorax]|uniref:type VII toxin-antitoxin system HepT family RNase toxin n=1 Tax=Desulfotruncus alcoholivorax TaxID=265477 RepID=UPI00041356C8|nr:DUF86 domain-containing protein [Desulfotruncus alcoholivorax]